jgi:hypothetical protein
MAPGNLFPSSPKNFPNQKPATPLLTGNYWQLSLPPNISVSSSKVDLSPSSQTTNPLFLPSQNNPLLSHLANNATFLSFLNSMPLFTIFLVIKILWLMHFPDQTFPQSLFLQQHPPPSFLFLSPTQLWPQHNKPMILPIP